MPGFPLHKVEHFVKAAAEPDQRPVRAANSFPGPQPDYTGKIRSEIQRKVNMENHRSVAVLRKGPKGKGAARDEWGANPLHDRCCMRKAHPRQRDLLGESRHWGNLRRQDADAGDILKRESEDLHAVRFREQRAEDLVASLSELYSVLGMVSATSSTIIGRPLFQKGTAAFCCPVVGAIPAPSPSRERDGAVWEKHRT